ncbi:MAG: hypothetical protein ABJL44_15660 [Algibacter sp.]
MILLISEPFPFQKTLLIALIGAIIGQSLVILIGWIKKQIDLSRKKQMIVNDLNNQNIILKELTKKHLELKRLFENRKTEQFTSSIYHVLQLDIYQSVQKNELHSIFKKDLSVLVEVYKSIEFIKNNGPYWIYKDYLEKSERHLEETVNKSNYVFYDETHIGFMEIAMNNIENNLRTIQDTISKIEKLTE